MSRLATGGRVRAKDVCSKEPKLVERGPGITRGDRVLVFTHVPFASARKEDTKIGPKGTPHVWRTWYEYYLPAEGERLAVPAKTAAVVVATPGQTTGNWTFRVRFPTTDGYRGAAHNIAVAPDHPMLYAVVQERGQGLDPAYAEHAKDCECIDCKADETECEDCGTTKCASCGDCPNCGW